MELTSTQDATLEKYRADVMSGRTLVLHAQSHRSRYGYMPPIGRQAWATCMGRLAQMASESNELAQVANAIIGRVNLYGDAAQAATSVYEHAYEAMNKPYDDVMRRASPEPGRYSDNQHEWTLLQRIAVMYWLEYACRPFARSAAGVGWALASLAEEINYSAPSCMKVSR